MSIARSPEVESLARLTRTLLDTTRPAYSLRDEVLALKSILETAANLHHDPTRDISAGETVTDHGVAISPTMAAMCIDDFARTVQFVRGVHAAIESRRGTISRPVQILYAGCGPLAPLAIPLMSVFGADEAKFTLLDIHPASLESAKRVLQSLTFEDRVERFEIGDAALHRIGGTPPDVIVVEMLRAALEGEPQVAVVRNLSSQAPEAVVVPEAVMVDLALVDSKNEFSVEGGAFERDRIRLARVFTLDRKAFGATTISIPDFDESHYRPMLLTTVRIFGDHVLQDYDSGITCPRSVRVRPGEKVEIEYRIGRKPGFTTRRIDS